MATKRYKVEDLEPFDAAEHLQDEESIQAYIAEMATENNAKLIVRALTDVARARKRWNLPSPPDAASINVDESPHFDVTDHLDNEEIIQEYLAAAREQGGNLFMDQVMAEVAQARKRWNLPAPRITLGSMAGRITMSDDFDAPLSDEELRDVPPTF